MVVLLDQLVRLAEYYKDGDALPEGIEIETRNGYSYISKRILNLSIAVLVRSSYITVA